MTCTQCGRTIELDIVSRRDTCPGCGVDLRSCVQCTLYTPGHYNDCREPQAERVLDKERANFCDYFHPSGRGASTAPEDPKTRAKAQLDALFRKP